MTNELITGYYVGNFYQINGKAHEKLNVRLNQENLQDVFANAMKDTKIDIGMECQSINNTPINFHGTIVETDDGNYRLIGELNEFLYAENDFDYKEEFEEYLQNEPDGKYDVDFTFSGEDLQNKLNEYKQIENGVHEAQSSAVIVYGAFLLSKDNIKRQMK